MSIDTYQRHQLYGVNRFASLHQQSAASFLGSSISLMDFHFQSNIVLILYITKCSLCVTRQNCRKRCVISHLLCKKITWFNINFISVSIL